MDRDMKLLSLGFALIFFGYNGVQQYVTAHFESLGLLNIGFNVLLIVYLSFLIASPLSPALVVRFRVKTCILASAAFYAVFIISLLSKLEAVLYTTSVFLGLAAGIMWTAQNTYIIRISSSGAYGARSGIFTTAFNLGTGLGMIAFGYVMVHWTFDLSIIAFSVAPVVGIIAMLSMKEPPFPRSGPKSSIRSMKGAFSSPTALRLGSIWFSFMFVMGMVIGILPLQINATMGSVEYIGLLSSLFYLLPIFTSYAFGRLSDLTGRIRLIVVSYVLGMTGLAVMCMARGPLLLIMGMALLAANYSLLRPITMALPGDLAERESLPVLVAFFYTFSDLGIFSALLVSRLLPLNLVYVVSFSALLISLILVIPELRIGLERLREKIAGDIRRIESKSP